MLVGLVTSAMAMTANVQSPFSPAPSPAVGDLDGDGYDEIVSWNGEARQLVLWAFENGQLVERAARALPEFRDATPVALAIADADGDGRLELVVASITRDTTAGAGPATALVIRLYQPLDTAKNWEPWVATAPLAVAEGNIGLAPLMLGSSTKPVPLLILTIPVASGCTAVARLANVRGMWTIEPLDYLRSAERVVAGDLFRTGARDLVVTRAHVPTSDAGVASQCSADVLEARALVLRATGQWQLLPVPSAVGAVLTADIDEDKQTELVIGTVASGTTEQSVSELLVMRRDENGWATERLDVFPGARGVREVLVANLDGKGGPELVVLVDDTTGGIVRVYQRRKARLRGRAHWRAATLTRGVGGLSLAQAPPKGRGLWGRLADAGKEKARAAGGLSVGAEDDNRTWLLVVHGAPPTGVPLELKDLSWEDLPSQGEHR